MAVSMIGRMPKESEPKRTSWRDNNRSSSLFVPPDTIAEVDKIQHSAKLVKKSFLVGSNEGWLNLEMVQAHYVSTRHSNGYGSVHVDANNEERTESTVLYRATIPFS